MILEKNNIKVPKEWLCDENLNKYYEKYGIKYNIEIAP